ncbi:HAD family hydrolase [Roseovarius sp. SCSIO 43702]|uniref:HAD family hydrolase n=1 Tax=Roseovarius sp. SCSIO 43702 TaxID=2823043 RepID=UPI001C73D724|nr:HAD family hydrolase [Roseovarius sp. SCSIO 43702]QYX57924.1 HAD family hydrolase [Roseovarius sp. SCSIO 43702]
MSSGPEDRAATPIEAVVFDKDGTLFDFHATWSTWAGEIIRDLAGGVPAREAALAREMAFDLEAGRFRAESPIVACTHREATRIVAKGLGREATEDLETYLAMTASRIPQVEAVPLGALLDGLKARGLRLGVMTNDTEEGAWAHLGGADVADRFDFVAGFDSGHGAKPDPDPLLAFARAVGVAPARVAMVGDSLHDLHSGRAAGMRTVGVLTGTATRGELAPHADVVLPDIGHLPAWLDR